MSNKVDPSRIETIVGCSRHPVKHWARAVSAEQTVYILHSQICVATYDDLRDCSYSLALDRGIEVSRWTQDAAVWVAIRDGRLVPVREQL